MIRSTDDTYTPYYYHKLYDYSGPFKSAVPIAEHYGFRLTKPIESKTYEGAQHEATGTSVTLDDHYKYSTIEHYLDNEEQLSRPAMLCHTTKAKNKNAYLNLEIFGVQDAFVETILLNSAFEILHETANYSKDKLLVEINSFGATESYERFNKELDKFLDKYSDKIPADVQEEIMDNPLKLYEMKRAKANYPKLEEVLLHLPRPVACLSEGCRNHLKQLLEHLESTGLPYHINPTLFPHSGKHTETVFQITHLESGDLLSYGERYTSQAKTLTEKKLADEDEQLETAAITIALTGGKKEKYKKVESKNDTNVYFAHVGSEAKRQALKILSTLKEDGIKVKHSIVKTSLREQLHHAERDKFPLTVILGVKEVQDGTIIIRNNLRNRQKAVPVSRLCSYLKRTLRTLK